MDPRSERHVLPASGKWGGVSPSGCYWNIMLRLLLTTAGANMGGAAVLLFYLNSLEGTGAAPPPAECADA